MLPRRVKASREPPDVPAVRIIASLEDCRKNLVFPAAELEEEGPSLLDWADSNMDDVVVVLVTSVLLLPESEWPLQTMHLDKEDKADKQIFRFCEKDTSHALRLVEFRSGQLGSTLQIIGYEMFTAIRISNRKICVQISKLKINSAERCA